MPPRPSSVFGGVGEEGERIQKCLSATITDFFSVPDADPDADPYPPDSHVFGPDPDPLGRYKDPDQDPIIKQKK